MSRGVENNACVISLNRFETTSEVVSVNPVRSRFNDRCRRGETGLSRFHCRSVDRP